MKLFAPLTQFPVFFRRAFARDKRGNVAIEYGLIAAAISVAIIGVVGTLGVTLRTSYFEEIVAAFTN